MIKNLVFNHNKKLFLGVLNEAEDSVIGFKQIKYSNNFSMLKNNEICLVMTENKEDKIYITPIQSLELYDDDGSSVILGDLSSDILLESINNVYNDFDNVIKSMMIH